MADISVQLSNISYEIVYLGQWPIKIPFNVIAILIS